jgi:hypothetical protein
MKLCTTSETISFAKNLEETAGEFYEALGKRYDEGKHLSAYKEENRKFAIQIQRAYQSVITDAIEGCFAFQVESDNYQIDTNLAEGDGFADAVQKALAMEEKIIDFYNTAADQSMSLMADIPRNFKIVVKKRSKRLDQLKSML